MQKCFVSSSFMEISVLIILFVARVIIIHTLTFVCARFTFSLLQNNILLGILTFYKRLNLSCFSHLLVFFSFYFVLLQRAKG